MKHKINVYKTLSVTITPPGTAEAPYRFVASTDSVDREGDVIVPDGMDSTDYERNPVILYLHDSSQPAVARCRKLYRMPRRIECDVMFPDRPDGHFGEWAPEEFKRLVDAGLLNAVSIRADVKANGWRDATKGDKERYGSDCRRVISRWSLIEISLVPIPMNQDAVVLALGKGLVSRESVERWFGKAAIPEQATPPEASPEPVVEKVEVAAEVVPVRPTVYTVRVTVPKMGTIDRVDVARMAVAKASGKLYLPT